MIKHLSIAIMAVTFASTPVEAQRIEYYEAPMRTFASPPAAGVVLLTRDYINVTNWEINACQNEIDITVDQQPDHWQGHWGIEFNWPNGKPVEGVAAWANLPPQQRRYEIWNLEAAEIGWSGKRDVILKFILFDESDPKKPFWRAASNPPQTIELNRLVAAQITSISPTTLIGGPGKAYTITINGKDLLQYGINAVMAGGIGVGKKALPLSSWSDSTMKVYFEADFLVNNSEKSVTEDVQLNVRYQPICNGVFSPDQPTWSNEMQVKVIFPPEQPTKKPTKLPTKQPTKQSPIVAYGEKTVPWTGKIYYILNVNIPGGKLLEINNPDLGLGKQWTAQIINPGKSSEDCGTPGATTNLSPGVSTKKYSGTPLTNWTIAFCLTTTDTFTAAQQLPNQHALNLTYEK